MSVQPISSGFVANESQFVFEFSYTNGSVIPYCQPQLFQCVDNPFECVSHPCDGNPACSDQSDELGLHCREYILFHASENNQNKTKQNKTKKRILI